MNKKNLLLTLLLSTNVWSMELETLKSTRNFERVIKSESHKTTITLNKETVRCSALGYGSSELKISIPSLKWNAIFDHSNNDNRGPCVTAGTSFCGFGNSQPGIPEVLLDEQTPDEEVVVTVQLTEKFSANDETCTRVLEEFVETEVRGISFNHFRIKSIGEISLDECNRIF